MTTMLDSVSHAREQAGGLLHSIAVRPSDSCGASNLTQATTSPPRRMVAVTVALSEPADGSPLDWSETVASVLRLAFTNTSVHVIDTWRCDQ